MSQAVAVIFAEYFGLDSSVDQKSSTSGLLAGRVGLLEQELADLKELVQKHLQSGGAMQEKEYLVVRDGGSPEAVSSNIVEPTSVTLSEPLEDGSLPEPELSGVLKNVEASSGEGDLPENAPSELVGELRGELPVDTDLPETESAEVKSPGVLENVETQLADGDASEIAPGELASSLLNEPLEKNGLPEKVKPETPTAQESLSYVELPLFSRPDNSPEGIQPISGKKLSKRLKLGENGVSGGKNRYGNSQRFIDWTRGKDPNTIGWKAVETPTPGYIPADELSSKQRDGLLTWMRQNGLL